MLIDFTREEIEQVKLTIKNLELAKSIYEKLINDLSAGWDYSRIDKVLRIIDSQIRGWKDRYRIN